jgi:hypothetical protein
MPSSDRAAETPVVLVLVPEDELLGRYRRGPPDRRLITREQ